MVSCAQAGVIRAIIMVSISRMKLASFQAMGRAVTFRSSKNSGSVAGSGWHVSTLSRYPKS